MSKSNSTVKFYPCPNCESPAATGTKTFPFCSNRCKVIDLGAWASQKYSIPSKTLLDENKDSDLIEDETQ